jgi:hypothetical protein
VIEKYKYDAFGAPTIYPPSPPSATPRPASIYNNRFLFTGREYAATYRGTYIPAFTFYEYRARAYNPTFGRSPKSGAFRKTESLGRYAARTGATRAANHQEAAQLFSIASRRGGFQTEFLSITTHQFEKLKNQIASSSAANHPSSHPNWKSSKATAHYLRSGRDNCSLFAACRAGGRRGRCPQHKNYNQKNARKK